MTDGFATGDGMADGALAIGDDGFAEAVMESDGALGEKARGGNGAWIRGEVAEASAILAARNLAHADAVAGPAHPKSGTLYLRFGKRALDVALSGIALLLTLPVNLVLAVLTYRDVGSPIFYVQERTGKDLKSFKMVKFRNMTEERDEDGELLPPEDRITKLGLFVRSHSLDELLNFWSVLKGDIPLRILKTRPEFSEKSMGAFALSAKSSTNKGKAFSQVVSCFANGLRMRRISKFNCNRIRGMEAQFLAKPVFGAVCA